MLYFLPDEIIVDIFNEWIELNDLCKVDSSTTNEFFRNQYFQLVSKVNWCPSYLTRKFVDPPASYYQWVFDRDIKLRVLCVKDPEKLLNREKYPIRFHYILKLVVVNKSELVLKLIDLCTAMTTIEIPDILVPAVEISVLQNLTSLKISGVTEISLTVVERVKQYCNKLKSMTMHPKSITPMIVEAMNDIIHVNASTLNSLFLSCDYQALPALNHCKLLKQVTLYSTTYRVVDIIQLSKCCKLLEDVRFKVWKGSYFSKIFVDFNNSVGTNISVWKYLDEDLEVGLSYFRPVSLWLLSSGYPKKYFDQSECLLKLTIISCSWLTGDSLLHILTSSRNLESLEIKECNKVKNCEILEALEKTKCKLNELSLLNEKLTFEMTKDIILTCTDLCSLTVDIEEWQLNSVAFDDFNDFIKSYKNESNHSTSLIIPYSEDWYNNKRHRIHRVNLNFT